MSMRNFNALFDAGVVLANVLLASHYIFKPPHSNFYAIPPDPLAIPNLCAGLLFAALAGIRLLVQREKNLFARRWAAMALSALILEIICFFVIAYPALDSLSAPGVDRTPEFSFDHSYALLSNWYVAQLSLDLLAGLFLLSSHRGLSRTPANIGV
ncbi:hypothetical protein [Vitreimonas sp.]|uniref:hypothetical protein n=1 Tax=Vitreimonas sp. TaxID=3069702 RepID=UPI002ED7E165